MGLIISAMTVVFILVHLWRTRSLGFARNRVVRVSLFYLLCVQWGFGAAFLAIPHILTPDRVAEFIGWPAGSPFQVELGFASFGISLLGILCIWIRGWFWLAPVVAQSVFLLGAGYVHIHDILVNDNLAPGNAGSILFYDLVVPLVGCSLFYAHVHMGGLGPAKHSPADRGWTQV